MSIRAPRLPWQLIYLRKGWITSPRADGDEFPDVSPFGTYHWILWRGEGHTSNQLLLKRKRWNAYYRIRKDREGR